MELPLFLHEVTTCTRQGEHMAHAVIYYSELHIVESKLQGDMTVGEVEEIVTKIAKLAKEKDYRVVFTQSPKEYIRRFWH
jgi:hypothetical protein